MSSLHHIGVLGHWYNVCTRVFWCWNQCLWFLILWYFEHQTINNSRSNISGFDNPGVAICCNWQLYLKVWHFWSYTYSERFDKRALFMLFTAFLKIHLSPKLKFNRALLCHHFLQLLTWINSATMHKWT